MHEPTSAILDVHRIELLPRVEGGEWHIVYDKFSYAAHECFPPRPSEHEHDAEVDGLVAMATHNIS